MNPIKKGRFGIWKPYQKDPPSFDSATRRRITEVIIYLFF